jgi:hypothetical protein
VARGLSTFPPSQLIINAYEFVTDPQNSTGLYASCVPAGCHWYDIYIWVTIITDTRAPNLLYMLDVVRLPWCICIWVSNLIYCTGRGRGLPCLALPPQLAPWLPACSWDLFPGPTNLPACNALNFHAHRPGGEMIGASSAFATMGGSIEIIMCTGPKEFFAIH